MIYGLGEIVLDILFKNDKPLKAIAGGSALNSIISLAHKNCNTEMISMLGNDLSGNLIMNILQNSNVGTKYILQNEHIKTPLALAFLNSQNDAEYQFYKEEPGLLPTWELPQIKANDILLISSAFSISNPGFGIIPRITAACPIIFYDPNVRKTPNQEQRNRIVENIKRANIIRASHEDMEKGLEITQASEAWEFIQKHGHKHFIYSCGSEGVYFFNKSFQFHLPGQKIKPISTVGAGDTLNAGIIYGIQHSHPDSLNERSWRAILNEAQNWATRVCQTLDNYLNPDQA